MQMVSVHPGWNPPQGYEWAQAQCMRQLTTTKEYTWVDLKYPETNIGYKKCMASYGYEQRNVCQDKK